MIPSLSSIFGWSDLLETNQFLQKTLMNFQLFRQNYQLRQVLDGSQSTVRKVVRRDTQQIFAAKIYESFIVKARHQIDMLLRLDHPSIVNIYEVYEEGPCIILILDYMAGGQLYDLISQRKRLTEAEVRHYIRILVDAVRYCHQCGVIHRDIKPQNLLLSTNGPDALLKLSDFGISKILTSQQLNTICGTPIYMAPQIWRMQPYNEKVDIWSIGVVTYYLLSGDYPFMGDDTPELIKSVCEFEVKFKAKIWDSVSSRGNPERYTAIVFLRDVLQKDKELRPSASQILNSIWFVEPSLTTIQVGDPNLAEAIINISREKIKTKKIRKQKEIKEIFNSSKLPKVRFQFLTFKDIETHLTTPSKSELSGVGDSMHS